MSTSKKKKKNKAKKNNVASKNVTNVVKKEEPKEDIKNEEQREEPKEDVKKEKQKEEPKEDVKNEEQKESLKSSEDKNQESNIKKDKIDEQEVIKKSEKNKENIEEQKEELKEDIKNEKQKENVKEEEKENLKNSETEKQESDENKDKVEEKPDYVQNMLKKKKRKTIIFICGVIIIILFMFFSTFFALFNVNNTNIITGITVKNIDLSGLSIEDSKNRLQEYLDAELLADVDLKYNDEYEITLTPSQIEFTYDIATAVNEAYSIGRNGNILENNYEILFTNFFGKEQNISYSYNEDLLNDFIDDVSSKIPGVVVNPTYYIEDENLIISQGTDGISVKKEELKELILTSIVARNYQEIYTDNYNLPIEIPTEETKAEEIDIEAIYSEVKCEPQDAYYELDPYQIYADIDGIDFDLEAAKEVTKEYQNEYTIPLTITKASKTIDDLGTEAFPYLISSFSTKYDASNVNRSTNLAIATEKINGKVLMPGEVFSFNKVVGKRTVEEGYKDAKIYADGGVVDGLAGGICQISSTLYNAVLLANLEIVERRNHSYTTSYVAAGRDATVVYGSIDFQFKNTRNYPIKIEASAKNGVAEFKIHGMLEETEYEIKIIPITTASIPYTTEYVQDASLAPGEQIVVQTGHAGYKVTTYIEKILNGELVSKEVLSNDTYSPMRTIIKIGP